LGSSSPAPGEGGVPRDGAVVFEIVSVRPGTQPSLAVTVSSAADGAPVAGEARIFWFRRLVGVWRPRGLLAENHRYRVVAELRDGSGASSTNQRSELEFTTGDERLPPLEWGGELTVDLERATSPDYSTCTPGRCDCKPTKTFSHTRARLGVPPLRGDGREGFLVDVMVTPPPAYDFAAPPGRDPVTIVGTGRTISLGAPTQLTADLARGETGAGSCFAWQVQDISGRRAVGAPVCLTDGREHGGCAFGGRLAPGGLALLLTIALALVRLGVRRAANDRPGSTSEQPKACACGSRQETGEAVNAGGAALRSLPSPSRSPRRTS
jgi:hypothetical protein